MCMKRIFKFYIIICFFIFGFLNCLFSESISKTEAEKVAFNFIKWQYYRNKKSLPEGIYMQQVIEDKSAACIYIFGVKPEGFIIISGDDAVEPVLAYSITGSSKKEDLPLAFKDWIHWCKNQIEYVRQYNISASYEIKFAWESLMSNNLNNYLFNQKDKSVQPLLTCKWDQGQYYNELCPADLSGPGGHVWAGCTATAMAQVMQYYKHPLHGYSSHSYYDFNYGYQFADFANTTYEWVPMINSVNSSNLAVATLMYHCGVAVEMNYSPSGSSASLDNAAYALRNYFRYSNTVKYYEKDSYPYSWENMLTSNLDAGKPVIYAGFDPDQGSGHAFVVDGYDITNYYHFNWGWSGYYNGYFYLDNLNPGTYDFTAGQRAVVNIAPAGSYPSYCNGTQSYTYPSGLFEDGSGPINNYSANADCLWLINPNNVDKITLKFIKFNTENLNDKLIVYDGADVNAPVLATLSGNSLPSDISSSSGALLVRFITNSTVNDKGWLIEYTSKKSACCSGTVVLDQPLGTFSDGSGSDMYDNNLNCKWHIAPPGTGSITIHFTEFEVEPNYDYVRIVDPTQSPALTLKTYSGFSIPADFTYSGPELLVLFKTGPSVTYQGWTAEYYTSPSAIQDYNRTDNFISLYPNPATDFVYIDFYCNETNENINIFIYDETGRLINENHFVSYGNLNKFKLPVTNLKKGVYFVNIVSNYNSCLNKLIIK